MSGITRDVFGKVRGDLRVAEAKADEALRGVNQLATAVDALAGWCGQFERVSVWRRLKWLWTGR